MRRFPILFVLAAACLAPAAAAQDRPPRGLFQERCAGCHEGVGRLVEDRLVLEDGVLRGRYGGEDLRTFLRDHVDGLRPRQVERLYAVLLRVAQGRGRFQERCAICHVTAEDLVHERLILADGVLRGRYTGREVGEYLLRHGTSSAEEAAFFERLLARIAGSQ